MFINIINKHLNITYLYKLKQQFPNVNTKNLIHCTKKYKKGAVIYCDPLNRTFYEMPIYNNFEKIIEKKIFFTNSELNKLCDCKK